MPWLFTIYAIMTVVVAFTMGLMNGLLFVMAALLAIAGGGGFRTSIKETHWLPGILIGGALLSAATALVWWRMLSVRFWQVEMTADFWILLGFVLAFLAAPAANAEADARTS